MRFWDASAIVPLIATESTSAAMLAQLEHDAQMLVWWGTPVEITAAVARREREGLLPESAAAAVLDALHELSQGWHEIVPSEAVRRTAARLLRTHALRSADSLQLAAALVASDHDARTLEFVCLDARLAAVARREGFAIVEG